MQKDLSVLHLILSLCQGSNVHVSPIKEGITRDCDEFLESMKKNLETMSSPELEDVKSIFESAGEFGIELLQFLNERAEKLSASEDPVLLVEEGERKAQYYKRRSELSESVITRVTENARLIIKSKDKEIEKLKEELGVDVEGKVEDPEELVHKVPEFTPVEEVELEAGEVTVVEDSESAEKLLKAVFRSKEVVSTALGELQKEHLEYRTSMDGLRKRYKESVIKGLQLKKDEAALKLEVEAARNRISRNLGNKDKSEAQLAEALKREEAVKIKLLNLQEANRDLQGKVKDLQRKVTLAESVARSVVKVSEKREPVKEPIDYRPKGGEMIYDNLTGDAREQKRLEEFLTKVRGG